MAAWQAPDVHAWLKVCAANSTALVVVAPSDNLFCIGYLGAHCVKRGCVCRDTGRGVVVERPVHQLLQIMRFLVWEHKCESDFVTIYAGSHRYLRHRQQIVSYF